MSIRYKVDEKNHNTKVFIKTLGKLQKLPLRFPIKVKTG